MAGQLYASAVQLDITPPVGTRMAGYGARTATSVGVHDPLLAQLLLLRLGERALVLITLDLLGVTLELTQQVRGGIAEAIGVPMQATMISCTHTHSGPHGLLREEAGVGESRDQDLQAILVRKLVGAAIWAQQRLRPARLSAGRGLVEGVGTNRNDPHAALVDNELILLRWDGPDGRPLAVWINYGCHATVLGQDNLWLSADFPGAARSALMSLYPDTVFLYANGASGDVSTRFTRRGQGFAEVERFGYIVAGEACKVMQMAMEHDVSVLDGRIMPLSLPCRSPLGVEEARRQLDALQAELEALRRAGASHGDVRRAETRVRGALADLARAQASEALVTVESEVQGLRIGDVALVGLPGEPFTQTVLQIKRASPWPVTAVVSYANDEIGYFPDEASFSVRTYEALKSLFDSTAAETLRDAAMSLLQSLGA